MKEVLRRVSRAGLADIAAALASGEVSWPPASAQLARLGAGTVAEELAAALVRIAAAGAQAGHVAMLLEAVADEREATQRVSDRVQLVWTGPEARGARTRDTSVVVRELFTSAERHALVATYAIFQGRDVFEPLARRMVECPALAVDLFVNVARPHGDLTPPEELVASYRKRFLQQLWPGPRLPSVFYDPRAVVIGGEERACLHAKCVVVDDARAFVTSANFTEAAQQRNIETGVLVDDPAFALALRSQFDALVARGELVRLP